MLHAPLRGLQEAPKTAITLTMSTVRTNAAAAMLGVSPNTLRSWERRFGYPKPRRTQGGHRQFELAEIEALRQAFAETHNVSSAITVARERGEGPSTATRLQSAFALFDEDKAGRLLEQSLAVRSVERTVEEVLLPAVQALTGDDPPSPEMQFAWRFASWLHDVEDYVERTFARVRRILTSATRVAAATHRPTDDTAPRRRFGLAFESRPPPLTA